MRINLDYLRKHSVRQLGLLLFSLGTLLLPLGFALQACGAIRSKNAAGIFTRSLANLAAAALAFWAIGAAVLFQNHSPWFSINSNLVLHEAPDHAPFEFAHLAFCLIGPAILLGAIAERSSFYFGVILALVFGGLIFPAIGHCIWFGKLHDWNFIDTGGATAIHLSTAVLALIVIAGLGRRRAQNPAGHALPMTGAGVMLLLVGWFFYLLGAVAAHWSPPSALDDIILGMSAISILLAAAGGVFGALLYSQLRFGKPDLFYLFTGTLGSLVAISSGVDSISGGGAILLGFIAGILVPMFAQILDEKARLDDPTNVLAVHGIGAIWGTLATAIFVSTNDPADHFKLFAIQCAGLAIIIAFTAAVGAIAFLILRTLKITCLTPEADQDGTDLHDHGVNAYPEFTNP